MTRGGLDPFDPDRLPPSQQARIHAGIDDLLTSPTLSDADADRHIDSILGELFPPTPTPRTPPPPPPPLQDWALDHAPPAPPEPLTAAAVEVAAPGGGQVELPHTADPDVEDQPEPAGGPDQAPDWDRFGLWSPPRPADIVVPAGVAAVAPVPAPTAEPPADPATPDPATPTPDIDSRGRRRPLPDRIREGWAALPGWARLAIPTAVGLSMVVVMVINLILGDRSRPAPQPPIVAAAPEQPAASKPLEGLLLPAAVTADCPAGSSDPTLAFGTDKSQAWICTRLYNVDNSILTITFPEPVVVTSIMVIPGFDYVESNGQDHWNEHRVVIQILWRIGGTQIVQDIAPTRAGATLQVPNLATQIITATILATQRPPATPGPNSSLPGILGGPSVQKVDDSMAIGRIEITGRAAGGPA